MNKDYIENEIQTRKIVYYPVSENDLKSLKEKSLLGDIFALLTSLALSIFLSLILTPFSNPNFGSPNFGYEFLILLDVVVWISGIMVAVFLYFAIYFNYKNQKQINSLIGKQPEFFSIKTFIKHENPNYYVGANKIILNIRLEQKDQFFRLFSKEKKYKLLNTKKHFNTIKTDHFTFSILNGNSKLVKDFKDFLEKNSISYSDYQVL